MALGRVKTWAAGDVLTAADLNAEFNNILNNGSLLVSPWPSATLDLDGNTLVLDADADTSIDSATDDTIDFTIAGADDFRFTANLFTLLAGSSLTVADGQTIVADSDARTTTVATPLTVRAETTGVAAAGIGTGILVQAESADEAPSSFGQLEFAASDVTAASEDTYLQVLLRVAGAALTSCYRFAATGAFNAIFTHANTAARTYTLQDANYTVVGRDTTDTLTNKTITTPIISGAAPATPVAGTLYEDSIVKGWVIFDVAGVIDADVNVSSVTDNGAGDWTVNWATAFATANYCPTFTLQTSHSVTVASALAGYLMCIDDAVNPTASALRVNTRFATAGAGNAKTDPTGTRVRMYIMAIGSN